MKLLYCPSCQDVFKLELTREDRKCKCGKVTGRYVNVRDAVTNGAGVSLAIGNGSLLIAVSRMRAIEDGDRGDYQDRCPILMWARPNDGPGNPHTTIEVGREVGRETGQRLGTGDYDYRHSGNFPTPCY